MGQAFRRAAGRVQTSSLESSSKLKNTTSELRPPPPTAVPVEKVEITKTEDNADLSSEGAPVPSINNDDNVLEERDPQYDAMLNQMVGRIKTKPGGKLEMGEAFVVERYDRPMPKLRNTKPDSGRYEERPVQPGTLNVAQLRHIILLHQGKADDHDGPMDVHQIAEKFRVDAVQVQRIVQFVSLPPEDNRKQKNN